VTDAAVDQNGAESRASLSLLERVRGRDRAAWECLVGLYGPMVYGWCLRAGLRAADAADVGQEVFASVARGIDGFRRDRAADTFRGWLYAVTRNKLRDRTASPGAAGTGGSDAQRRLAELPAGQADDTLTNADAEEANERRALCRRAIDSVRAAFEPRTWQAFWRAFVDGRAPVDVASDLGITVAAVYLAKSRILWRLREEFAALIDFGPAGPREPARQEESEMDSLDNLPGGALCPGRKDLAAFNRGDLPPEALDAIGEHLSRCPRCLRALGAVAGDDSSAVRDLRRSLQEPAPDSFAADPEYRRMQDAALRLSPAGGAPDPWLSDAPGPDLTPPFALGQYQIVEKIGQGGMGSVYRALHPRLKKEFAVKILRAESMADPRATARFQREMEAIGRLDHNNIVRATDAGEARGLHFLVMELVAGIDLSRLVRLRGPLPVADACELVRQAAAGLQCAHEHELVHRDVKPSNLVLSTKGEVKVLDLGLALLTRSGPAASELTVSGQVMGTPDYTAPEQWEASHAVDIRADVYSLGCTLYTLLVGRPPFAGPRYASAPRKMAAHLGESVPPVTDHRQDVPAAVVRFLERMVAKEPAERPSAPAEVAQALEPFARGADLAALARQALTLGSPGMPAPHDRPTLPEASRPVIPLPAAAQAVAPPVGPGPAAGRRRRAVGIAAAVLLTAAAVVTLGFWGWGGSRPLPDGQTADSRPGDPEGWQNLLATPPEKRLWLPALNARLTYDPRKEVLWLQSSSHALIRLGTTNARGERLQIGLHQPRWVGGIGVYFGGRPGDHPDTFRFQLIELRPRQPNSDQFNLVRSLGALQPGPETTPQVATQAFARWPLVSPPDNKEKLLELIINPGGLASVRWNGDPCADLVADSATQWAKENGPGDQGEFGVYCLASSVTVSTARFLPTE
jgi:RNA polymerase sigma factor (sigma-70 family)